MKRFAQILVLFLIIPASAYAAPVSPSPGDTVVSETASGVTATAGVSRRYSRTDHAHGSQVASGMTFSAISANTGTNVQQAIENASIYRVYDHTAHSIYSGSTATGCPWTTCPTGEITLATFTIPGGQMQNNGKILLDTLYQITSGSNTKTIRIRIGGASLGPSNLTTIASGDISYTRWIKNLNSENSQLSYYPTASSLGWSTTSSINTAATFTLGIHGTTSPEPGIVVTSGTGNGTTCTANYTAHGYNSLEYIQAAGGSNCTTSGNPNADPVVITRITADQFTYPCSCNGNMQSTFPTTKRYTPITLKTVDVEIVKQN